MMGYNQDIILEFIRGRPGTLADEIAKHTDINRAGLGRPLRSLLKYRLIRYEVIDFHGTRRYWAIP